jgi:SAM-dependent methyltransferase
VRVLDLGCGVGLTPSKLVLPSEWSIVGVDINAGLVRQAARSFPHRLFVVGNGCRLPFASGIFDRVIANVALPYMNIPKALSEIRRVLKPDGRLWASLHPANFTLLELRRAFPRPLPTIRGCAVLMNGAVFHMSGYSLGESFQTKRGIRLALMREGFLSPRFHNDAKRWIVETSPS